MPETRATAGGGLVVDIDRYVMSSSALSVFLWPVLYSGAFNFYLGYLIVLGNSLLLLARGELVIHRTFALGIVTVTLVSLTAAITTQSPVRGTVAEMVGLSVFAVYYFSLFHRNTVALPEVMDIYIGWAKVTAAFGYPIWLYEKAAGHDSYRFCSWFAEPSHYAYATLPAVCYILSRTIREKRLDWSAAPLLISYVLADSSTGFIGMGIGILLMADFRSLGRLLLTAILIALAAWGVYNVSSNVKQRVDDTIAAQIQSEEVNAISERKQEENPTFGSNATTFALVSNAYVSWRALLASPIIGHGLATHSTTYDIYAPEIVSPHFRMYGLNRDDANSLILRLMSETGLFGLFGVFYLLIYFGRTRTAGQAIIRNALLPYFVMRLVRLGDYFSLENFFFMMLYAFNYLEYARSTAPPATQLTRLTNA
jgi:hypothetical protein